jgi:hypothetical protein
MVINLTEMNNLSRCYGSPPEGAKDNGRCVCG